MQMKLPLSITSKNLGVLKRTRRLGRLIASNATDKDREVEEIIAAGRTTCMVASNKEVEIVVMIIVSKKQVLNSAPSLPSSLPQRRTCSPPTPTLQVQTKTHTDKSPTRTRIHSKPLTKTKTMAIGKSLIKAWLHQPVANNNRRIILEAVPKTPTITVADRVTFSHRDRVSRFTMAQIRLILVEKIPTKMRWMVHLKTIRI